MGDVYRLVSDPLVKDTPADRRKIDVTMPLARMNHQRESSEHRSSTDSLPHSTRVSDKYQRLLSYETRTRVSNLQVSDNPVSRECLIELFDTNEKSSNPNSCINYFFLFLDKLMSNRHLL
ncbi:uncharacterized protein LOC122533179 [Frieseomelitta varia]|uniref:uncharacterized protein LOC122533179 n=1 Tax=Frieseomelitta varia TaxID=561572 RepID=UPI001CB6A34B|nr:uncharacterized protein LOC122533179 [Frieseomelitta varia]